MAMDDEFVTSRWSDSESSTSSLRRSRATWRRGNTRQNTSALARKEKPPLHHRIASALGLKRDTKDKTSSKAFDAADGGLRLQPDPDARINPTYRRLPEEHNQSEELARRIQSQEQLIQEPRILRGPVPRQPTPGEDPRFATKDANALREELDFVFLAPCEKQVLFLLRQTRRASRFRPLLEPQHELLLVNVLDYDNILAAQTLVRELPEDERQLMWSNLHGQLPAHQLYTLRLVLFNPEIQITTHTRGSGVESPEVVSRPDTTLFFGRVQELAFTDPKKIRWEDTTGASPNTGTLFRRETSAPQLTLRGGGGGDSWRSLRTYHDHFRSSRSVRRLEDEERPPTVLWWLAGGNNRRGRKIPTGSELRARRAAEKENRPLRDFWGTVHGARSQKSRPTETAAGDSGQQTDVENSSMPPASDVTTREIVDDSARPPNDTAEAAEDGSC